MIISLGSSCQVSGNIKRLTNRCLCYPESMFFDNIVCDFKSVLYIFKSINTNNNSFLEKENYTKDNVFYDRDNWIDNTIKIENINFKMVSVHDIGVNYDFDISFNYFIERYKRRYNRLKNILINYKKTIHFIFILDTEFDVNNNNIPTEDDFNLFINYIKNINIDIKFYLHILIPPLYYHIKYNNIKNVIFYYLTDDNKYNDIKFLWMNTKYNWLDIFINIDNLELLDLSN